ncbi:MAG: class I tRNA ligase family protein, partial [Paracoccaceae bacterium]
YLNRVWTLCEKINDLPREASGASGAADADLERAKHRAIFEVTQNIENFAFNKAIANLYEFTNILAKSKAGQAVQRSALAILAQLMAPMVPHLSEEIWQAAGGAGFVVDAAWPRPDTSLLIADTVTMPIQVNGKRRSQITVPKNFPKEEVEKLALADDAVRKALNGGVPKKLIIIADRIINVVI